MFHLSVTYLENASYNNKLDAPAAENEEGVETISLQDV